MHARQRARDIVALLGFEHQEQIRLSTAALELARNAFRYASNGTVEFLVRGEVVLVATVKSLVRLHRTESHPNLLPNNGKLRLTLPMRAWRSLTLPVSSSAVIVR